MAGFGFILGGALAGAGDALEKRVEEARKARMIELEESLKARGDERRHGFALAEEDVRNKNDLARDDIAARRATEREDISAGRAGEREDIQHAYRLEEQKLTDERARAREGKDDTDVTHYTEDDTGETIGFDKKGRTVKTGVKSGEISKADEALLNRAERFATTKKQVRDVDGNATTEETIDPTRAASFLKRQGREDLAQGYQPNARIPYQPTEVKPRRSSGATDADLIAKARKALDEGAPRASVIERLKSLGVANPGL